MASVESSREEKSRVESSGGSQHGAKREVPVCASNDALCYSVGESEILSLLAAVGDSIGARMPI